MFGFAVDSIDYTDEVDEEIHEEIGEILNISESTSRTQYMRGKKKLLEMLKNQ